MIIYNSKEKQKKYNTLYYNENKERILKRNKEYAARNKGKIKSLQKEYSKDYYYINRKKLILRAIKNRAKKNNLDFNLCIEDLVFPEYCPVLNIKLDSTTRDFVPSVDRIDNNRGYTKDNI